MLKPTKKLLHIDNKIRNLGAKFGPRGSKMEVLGGHIWVQEWFGRQGPTRCAPKGSFLFVLELFLITFWIRFWWCFRHLVFLIKNHYFLKMMVSPRREHHFWRLGADLEGPRNDQNEPKVLSERCKKAMHEKYDFFMKNMIIWKTLTLTKQCIYCAKLMFLIFCIE